MTLKSKMSLLVFLTSLSIVSVGFSSWSITVETNAEINGNIEVDNVINNNDIITQTTSSNLTFTRLGFTDANNKISKTNDIIVDYKIDLTKCEEFLTKDNLSTEVTIKYAAEEGSFNIFEDYSQGTNYNKLTLSYSTDGNETWDEIDSEDYIVSDYQCVTSINLDNVLAENHDEMLSFSIKYSFEVTSGKYFYDNFYSVFNTQGFEFLVSAILTDY